ncbi:uncharacterized protein LOC115364445 isoform X2 [Myripristis murdjan]|uniref:uncharacterized protein LOC115364445 isoform X2 n=1 Tax=Myripristis murdjan TaxID=586833 RepID=UPI00117603DD|nr:uncharacterized protein LOC115364445 isoform X2 [Myripristis murdjan]
MPSLGLFVLILGLVMASAIAQETTTVHYQIFTTLSPEEVGNTSISNHTAIVEMNTSMAPSTSSRNSMASEAATAQDASVAPVTHTLSPEDGRRDLTSTQTMRPAEPNPTSSTVSTTQRSTTKQKITTPTKSPSGDTTGIIIIVVMIICFIVLGGACYFTRKRSRRYSVDLNSRPDDAQIPLSTVEPDETAPQNGLQTFASAEIETKEAQEPDAKPEAQEEQKADADKSVAVDASADPAAAAPSPDSSADKAKEDTAEPTPAAPVELNVEEKTDDESVVSNKTSVESLKEPNENNSNNSAARDWYPSNFFFDVPLDSAV